MKALEQQQQKQQTSLKLWKLNNSLLSDHWVIAEIMKEIKDFLAFNENECTTYPNLLGTMKAFLREKLIALSASKKKLERAYTSNFIDN